MKYVIVRFYGKDERRSGTSIMPVLSFVSENDSMYDSVEPAVKDRKAYEFLYPESTFEVMQLLEVIRR